MFRFHSRACTIRGLLALILALVAVPALVAQPSDYSLSEAPLPQPLQQHTDMLVTDMQKDGLAFSFDRFKLMANGYALHHVSDFSASDAAHLFDLLGLHITAGHVTPHATADVYELLLDRVEHHSPNWKAEIRNTRTLKKLFGDGGQNEKRWLTFTVALSRVNPHGDDVLEFLVIDRFSGLCFWIETN